MGEVYLAEAIGAAGFAKRLVIKTLRADLAADQRLVDQFVAEGRLLELLDHPNIAQILDLGMFEQTYFLAMEYVEGRDLRDLRRALPPRADVHRLGEVPVLCILAAIAEALEHAATRRGVDGAPLAIVHHDVTPSNIMVRRDGHVKLVDFGVARSAVWQRLDEGVLRGKLPYLSPEQAAMQSADGRADVFSLGLVAYELLAGERALDVVDADGLPQAFDLLPARLRALAEGEVSAPTVALIDGMLARDRQDRISSAAEVSERAKERLVALGVVSNVRSLTDALEPAFEALERRDSGFDRTLAAIVAAGPGALDGGGAADGAGTLSLPGISGLARPVTQPPLSQPPLPQPPLSQPASPYSTTGQPVTPGAGPSQLATPARRRLLLAVVALLMAAGAAGWWLGASDRQQATEARVTDPPGARPPATPAVSAPVAMTPATAPAPSAPPPQAATVVAPAPSTGTDEPPPGVDPPPAQVDAGPSEATTAPARKAQATFRFLVFPADGEVAVDGRKVPVVASGRYVLPLSAGRHVIVVRDPISGRQARHIVTLGSGEDRTLPGGFRLVTDLP